MQVHGLTGFDSIPDFDALTEVVMEQMVGKYRLLSQIPVQKHGRWYWEDDNDFSIARHVRRVVLGTAGPKPCAPCVDAVFDTFRPKSPLCGRCNSSRA